MNKGTTEQMRDNTCNNIIDISDVSFSLHFVLSSAAVKIAQSAPIIAPRNVGGGGGKVGTLTITWDVCISPLSAE